MFRCLRWPAPLKRFFIIGQRTQTISLALRTKSNYSLLQRKTLTSLACLLEKQVHLWSLFLEKTFMDHASWVHSQNKRYSNVIFWFLMLGQLLTLPHSLHLISLLLILSLGFFSELPFLHCPLWIWQLHDHVANAFKCSNVLLTMRDFWNVTFFIATIHYFINAAYLKETNNKKNNKV